MNISFYASEFTTQVSQISPSTITSLPGTLWAYYVYYLWYYEPDSWVAKTAYSFRILAVLVSLPVVILGLLDLASYGIARTLGVIDDVKASTSDKATVHAHRPPSILINGVRTPSSDSAFSDSDRDSIDHTHHNLRSPLSGSVVESDDSHASSQPSLFYVGDDNNFKLSGVDVFSPAASRPPSPTISRRNLVHQEHNAEQLRHRTQGKGKDSGDLSQAT